MNKNLIIAFSIGEVFSIGTQFYIAYGFHNFNHKLPSRSSHIEFLFPYSLITLGLMNALNVFTEEKYVWLIGLLVGILFSSLGILIKLNKFWKINEFQARMFALIYYPLLFGFVISPLNKYLLN